MKTNKTTLYQVGNMRDMSRLEKKANFKYIDRYTGKLSKKYKKVFKRPGFLRFITKLNQQPLVVAPIAILGKRGFGVIATEDIKIKPGKIKPLGVYWGEYVKNAPATSKYIFTVIKDEVDARKKGNWTRFVNHAEHNANVTANLKYHGSGKKRLPYMEYGLSKSVKAGEQLLIDYGPEYEFDNNNQIFLNPSNGYLTFAEMYTAYKQDYQLLTGKLYTLCKQLLPTAEKLFIPKLNKHTALELPIIAADKHGRIFPDQQQAGLTPLMLAAYAGDVKTVKSLLKLEASLTDLHIWTGQTALFYAVQSKATPKYIHKIVELLLTKDTDIRQKDVNSKTILHWCIESGNISTLKAIFNNKRAKSNAIDALEVVDKDGYCPTLLALSKQDLETATSLIKMFNHNYKKTFFTSYHHPKLIPILKKIMKQYSKEKLQEMYKMFIRCRLSKHSTLARMIRKKLM